MQKFIRSAYKNELYAVLFGGAGCEHDISLLSAANFIRSAKDEGFSILPIYIDKSGNFFMFCSDTEKIGNDFSPTREELVPTFPMKIMGKCGFWSKGNLINVRLCVPILHGDFGEDGKIQGLLELAGIKFIGADTLCGAVSSDKAYTKAIAESVGVPTVKSLLYIKGTDDREEFILRVEKECGYPAFVKPCRLGSSIGAYRAASRQELRCAIKSAEKLADRVLAECAIDNKRELECAYLSVGETKIITPPGEAVSKSDFYDFDAKYKSSETELFPVADAEDHIKGKLIEYTEILANALGVRHIARFDYFLTTDGNIFFNEVNTFPGMTTASLYSAMLKAAGMDFGKFIRTLLQGEM